MKKALFSAILILCCVLAHAQNYKQYTIFIYSFTRYIQWPEANNQGDFEILVLGDSPLLEELKTMAQHKKIGDRAIKVTKIASASEVKKCHMLFIPADRPEKLGDILSKVDTQPVLVITEQTGLGAQGSCINFITKEGKLAFELNQSALTKQNLKASIELTRLATMI
jgi:nitrogen regulatory protein PII